MTAKHDNPSACQIIDLEVTRVVRKLNRKAVAALRVAVERSDIDAMLAERTKTDDR